MRKLNLGLTGKRGNVILDSIMVLIVIFGFSFLAIIGYKLLNDVNTDIQADADISPTAKTNLDNLNTRYPTFMDNAFILILILLTALVIVASFVVDSHPVFFIFTIILLIVLLFVGGTLTNSYQEIMEDGEFGNAQNIFPKTYFVMTHLIQTLLLIAFMVVIALYSKSRT